MKLNFLLAEVVVWILSQPTCWSMHLWGSGKWEILLNIRNPQVRVMDLSVDWCFLYFIGSLKTGDCWICDQDVSESRTYMSAMSAVRPCAIPSIYGMFTVLVSEKLVKFYRKSWFLMSHIFPYPDEISDKRVGSIPMCSKCSYFQLWSLFLLDKAW